MAATAIAATVLLAAGVYHLAIFTEQARPLQTASGPAQSDSRIQMSRRCYGPTELATGQPRIEPCAEIAGAGPARPANQSSDTALLRAPNGPVPIGIDIPKSDEAVADMVRRGQALSASGKILAARSVLKEATDAHSAEAALALGMTYDPVELEHLGIRDIAADTDVARYWYQKARELGSAEAQDRLDRLSAREGQAR
jgi:hypothetical protein